MWIWREVWRRPRQSCSVVVRKNMRRRDKGRDGIVSQRCTVVEIGMESLWDGHGAGEVADKL